jgi:prepilin-type processing-associated H-X9-DG protein
VRGATFEFEFDGLFVPLDDGQDPLRVLPASAVTDGLSQTIAFSEKPIGSGSIGTYHPFRDWHKRWNPLPITAELWLETCSMPGHLEPRLDAGSSWMIPGAIYSQFFASAPPNSRVPDCGVETIGGQGVFAARSYHPGGLNAAMADGSVRWVSAGIQADVWRGLATRAGAEILNLDH